MPVPLTHVITPRRVSLVAVAIAIGFAGWTPPRLAAQAREPLPPQALAQIEALLREKESRSPVERRIDSRLLREMRRRTGALLPADGAGIAADMPYAADGHLVVDVRARVSDALLAQLTARGLEVLTVDRGRTMVRTHVDVERLTELAALPGVAFVQPRQQMMTWRQAQTNAQAKLHGVGTARGEGDVAHLAHAARAAFGVNGAGVRIGVISDGVTNLAASQALGDLGPVTVLPGQAGSGDEGTAMLEIVHDLAPGAQLFFATARNGITGFADNIRALRAPPYECDIIIDDVIYFAETPFHDGQPALSDTNMAAVIQAVNDVAADGALYFSSAGNGGNLTANTSSTWEGNFLDSGNDATTLGLPSGRIHSFGPLDYNIINSFGPVTTLHWSDPIGASSNDYDIFAFNHDFTLLYDWSTNPQDGTQDPVEGMSSFPGDRVVIVKKNGDDDRFLRLSGFGARFQFATEGEIHGHAAAEGAIAVGAASAGQAFPLPFNAGHVLESFTSDGPRRVFFQADGTQYTPSLLAGGGILRQKPDITAADGVRVTGVGGFPTTFFGTSAAAPHAGAIAALLLAKNPALTPANVRTALAAGALDVSLPGTDRNAGAGIVMADAALRSISGTNAALAPMAINAFDAPGNGNSAPEAGEGAFLSIEIGNYGTGTATAISGTVSSLTPGITVTQPALGSFPDLATSATAGPNGGPGFRFTVASNFPCPQSASFALTLNATGTSGPQTFNFSVPIGPPAFTAFNEALDPVPPVVGPGVTTATGVQLERMNVNGAPSACGATKPFPGLFVEPPPPPPPFTPPPPENPNRRFDAYTVNTCGGSAPSCVTVSLSSSSSLFSASYAPSFDPGDIAGNYRGDAGARGGVRSYSFDLAAGAQAFTVAVHQINGDFGAGENYFLSVEGACSGLCATPNQLPVARAKNVTLTATTPTGVQFVPIADIDDGSYDPDGEPLSYQLDDYGPYPIGVTTVLLTVTDPKGAASQASATITVNPQPSLSIADVTVAEGNAGEVNADFVLTLSAPSTYQVTAFVNATTQTADFGDFFPGGELVQFLPGEVTRTFTVLVKSNAVLEPDETFLVDITFATGATIADAQAIGTIVNDDQAVTEARVTQAVADGGARLQTLQRPDGGWFFRVGDTDCRAGPGVSCLNTVGITALGLLAAHTMTGEASLLTSAIAAGDFLVARYTATIGAVPPVLPASQDVEFLAELGDKIGGANVYKQTAADWFARVTAAYPNAADYVNKLIADRGLYPGVGVWNVGSLIRSAKAVLDTPYALAAANHVTSPAVEAIWKDVDPMHRWDKCGNPGGCGSPNNPFGYDYTLIAMGTLLNAVHDLMGFDFQKMSDYFGHLASQQHHDGSWDVGDVQMTSYVVLGIASFDPFASWLLEPAVAFLVAHQQPAFGWPAYAITAQLGPEYSEVDAEVVRAIFTLYNTLAGEGVAVEPAQLSTVTFSTVTQSGRTSVVARDLPAGTAPTPGVDVLPDHAYDVSTTAGFTGATTVCFAVPSIADPAAFANLRVLHKEGDRLVDRTILGTGADAPDFERRRVCARVASLSPFAIGRSVRDAEPPRATVTLSPAVLAPADHRLVRVTATITVTDNADPAPRVKLLSITSSERDRGLGKGDKAEDIRGAKIGADDRAFRLRAERFSKKGRVYTVTYRVIDRSGNRRDVTAEVVVPSS